MAQSKSFNCIKKSWPDRNELLAWFIYDKIQSSPCEDLDNPDMQKIWLIEFERTAMVDLHRYFYGRYNEYRVEHVNPYYLGYPESQNSKR